MTSESAAGASPQPRSISDLAAQARDSHVVVVGGGMAGLVVAMECAKVGIPVTVLEASDRVGGVLRTAEVAGILVDAGAESYATRGGTVRALVGELGMADAVVAPNAGRAWVAGVPGVGAAPLPAGGVLGIPENPFAPDVRRVIGWSGAWRAYVDRLRPPLTIGREQSLGALVRSRMGVRVVDRLVAPVTAGVYSSRPDEIDVDLAAPGLSAALTRTGSLSGAVAQLTAARVSPATDAAQPAVITGPDAAKAPGGAVEGIAGGMARLPAAIRARIEELGGRVETRSPVSAITRADGGWAITVRTAAADVADASGPADESGAAGPGDRVLTATAVVVAAPERVARDLLAPLVPGLEPGGTGADEPTDAPVIELITLVLDAPALDARPRGTGVLTVPGSFRAKALTHSTAKWAWVAEAAHGAHIVRVSFGTQGERPATSGMDDADAAALALAEASALLGVPLTRAQLRGAHRERYTQSQPASVIGRAARSAAARSAIHGVPGLAATGAWLAGTGLAQVVPDAVREAERVRRGALFGAVPAED
ncbi:protoporphyrinogen oxidase [Microbacterium sp. P03]|uniref:protoporphyrinogen oxidase n=1 Tax=Microbacterium sp. P03 TaxID=3366946 RepID=UPI003745C650